MLVSAFIFDIYAPAHGRGVYEMYREHIMHLKPVWACCGHTTHNIPVPVRSPKSNWVRPHLLWWGLNNFGNRSPRYLQVKVSI